MFSRRYCLLLLLGLLLPAAGLALAGNTVPGITPGEVIRFTTTALSSGAPRYKGEYRYSVRPQGTELWLVQSGHLTFANGNQAEEESILIQRGSRLLPHSFRHTVTNPSGKVIRTERMAFDVPQQRVHVERTYQDPTRKDDYGETQQINKWVQVPPETYARQMFDALLRTMDLEPGSRRRLYCITRMGEVYPMILAGDGAERVSTAAGTYNTVRVRIIPDIPLLPRLMPSLIIRLWYTQDKPHLPVKFEGYPQPPPPKLQEEVRMVIDHLSRP